jgi:3-phenylpropionate/cinnamic acid dioxygenase small subunit
MDPTDIVHIQQLMALYGHVLDDGQWHRLSEVFSDDALADYSSGATTRVLRGIDEIVAFFSTANASSAHHVSNVYVYEQDGQVRASTKFFVPYTRPEHQPHRWYGGNYEDVLVSTADGWRIGQRTVAGRWQLTVDGNGVPQHRRTF